MDARAPQNISLLDRSNPPALTRVARSGALSQDALRAATDDAFAGKLSGARRVAWGLLLLWHDHWEAAHKLMQSDEGQPDHDMLHGILHRQEKDYDNSLHWFREAGPHAFFAALEQRLPALLKDDPALAAKILPGGAWNPANFLKEIKNRREDPLLRAVQGEELIAFYECLTR